MASVGAPSRRAEAIVSTTSGERPLQAGRAVVERDERRPRERDGEPARQPERVLGVAGGIVGGAARGDEDEPEVAAREVAGDPPDARPLADEEPGQDVGLLADLGAQDGAAHLRVTARRCRRSAR